MEKWEGPQPGARWGQLRARALSTPERQRAYEAGRLQSHSYRETMRLIDGLRRALGISQEELACRLQKQQPTISRLLSRGQNPTLASVEETLRALGLRGRLIIEVDDVATRQDALTVEVNDFSSPRRGGLGSL